MSADSDLRLLNICQRCSFFGAVLTGALGVTELLGWLFNISFLRAPIPTLAESAPGTAAMLLICSFSYLLALRCNRTSLGATVARSLAFIVFGMCLVMIMNILSVIRVGIDTLSVPFLGIDFLSVPMAPNTIFNFLLISASVVLLRTKFSRRFHVHQWISVVVMSVAWLSLVGYIYGEPKFYDIELF
ncbi:MAG TPA: hypothetical protein V6C72_04905, partial [Chroococcales cyanobacterium]